MDFARPTIFSATIQIAVTLSIWAWQSWAVSYSIQCCGNIEMVSGSRWWFTAISAPLPPRLYKLFADKSSLFGGSHWWPCCHMFKHLPSGKLTWQWKITLYAMNLFPSLNICSIAEIHRGYQRISSEIDEISVTHRVNVSAHSTQVGMHILLPRFV
jgi:hypothetical protein